MYAKPNVVVLTGAGVSAESGLKTFRDNNGLWEQHKVEEVATPQAFSANPALVYRFYNDRRAQLADGAIKPNAAHLALAQLEKALGEQLTLITQNVDNLHERAGSTRVLHMHGELLSSRCTGSGHRQVCTVAFDRKTRCQCCAEPQPLRPDIVWFGETPLHMDTIIMALSRADIFIAIGTSGDVYPAAGFVQLASESGAKTVELNLAAGTNQRYFDEAIEGPASEVVPAYVHQIITAFNDKGR